MAVRYDSSDQVDRKVGRPPMPGMLNLHQVLELVKHRFHKCPSPEDALFVQQAQAIGRGALEMGHQPYAPSLEQVTGQRL